MVIAIIFMLAGIIFMIGTLVYVRKKNNLHEIGTSDKTRRAKTMKSLSSLW